MAASALLILGLAALLLVLLMKRPVAQVPGLTVSNLVPPAAPVRPEMSFEEKLLAVVPEGLDYDGIFICPDGKRLAYSTGVKGSRGELHRAVLGDAIGNECGSVLIVVSPDGKTFASVGGPGSLGNKARCSVDVGPTTGELFDLVDQFSFSADSRTYAYRAKQGNEWFVVVGRTKQPPYDYVDIQGLGYDGSVHYRAQRGGRHFLVDGDKVIPAEQAELQAPAGRPDGRSTGRPAVKGVAFVDFREEEKGLFRRTRVRKEFVVVDGKKGEEFDHIEGLHTNRDGIVAYKAFEDGNSPPGSRTVFVVQGGRKGPHYASIGDLDFSPDGKVLVYTASQGQGWFLVVNSKPGAIFEGVAMPLFNPDGSTFAYIAQRNGKSLIVLGEREGEEFDRVEALHFGRDGKTPVYGAWKDGRRYVVSGDTKTEDVFASDFDYPPPMVISPDGRTVAYRVSKNNPYVIVGGRRFNDAATTDPIFSPDGTKVAFGSVVHSSGRSELWWKVISGPFDAEEDPLAPPAAPEDGLVGYWKLDEAEAIRAFDSSGKGNHGRYMHAPEASSEIPGSKFKNPASRHFVKGAPQRIEVPESPSLSLHGSLSLLAWIRPADEERSSDQGILIKCDWVYKSHAGGYSLRLLKNGHPVFSVRPDRGGTRALVATAHRVPPDTWTHVAGVYDLEARSSRLYLNGELVASEASVPPPFFSNEPLWIGSDDAEGQFHGMLDEVRVYRRALSESEIVALASGEPSSVLRFNDPAILARMKALWLGRYQKSPDHVTLVELETAAQALLAQPRQSANAVAFLGDVYARSRNARLRASIAGAFAQDLEDKNHELREAAASALGYPGPFPARMNVVLSHAIQQTPDKGIRSAFMRALMNQGWAAADALMAVLSGDHTPPGEFTADCPDLAEFSYWMGQDVRAEAIDGKRMPSVLPQLRTAAGSPDRAVRAAVAQVLGTYAGRNGETYALVSAAFLPLLRDPEALVRERALKTFSTALIGTPQERELYRSAVDPLLVAMKDAHPGVRLSAVSALREFSSLAPSKVAPALRQALGDSDPSVREMAAYGLKQMAVPAPAETPAKRVRQAGGQGGEPFIDLAPRGGLLVGFRVTVWNTGDREFIKSLVPLYRVGVAEERGKVHGQPSGPTQETLARPGYAIGGLIAQGDDRFDGFMAVFMKIIPGGLDPKDKYLGDWIGGRRVGADVFLGEDAVPVIGVSGRQGADIDALGLVLDPAAALDAAPLAVDGEGFIQRWLVLGAIPLGDLSPDGPEALVKPWIPNLTELRPQQHEKALLGDLKVDWRVGNSAGFALWLGREENSVSIALSYLVSDRDIPEAILLTGSDDASIWYLNGREVQRFVGRRPLLRDQDRSARPVPLKKGTNVLVAVVVNAAEESGACARFVDSAGRPLELLAGAEPPR
jgi:HEAT repeat protein